MLQRYGRAPGFGPIARINGRVEAEGRAYFTQEVVDQIGRSIIDRLNSKAAMFGTYDCSTWLLIYIDDALLPMEGLSILLAQVGNAAAKSPFVTTFLVGSTEQNICELIGGTAQWAS